MKTYLLKPGVRQAIAKAGETDIAVAYNAKTWLDDYPAGIPQLMVTRPDGVRLPVTVEVNDDLIVGQVPNELLANPGMYGYVFVWVSGTTQLESGRCECMVLGSDLAKHWSDVRKAPDWAERIFLAACGIEAAVNGAMEARNTAVDMAENAAASSEDADTYKDAAAGSAEAAAISAAAAQGVFESIPQDYSALSNSVGANVASQYILSDNLAGYVNDSFSYVPNANWRSLIAEISMVLIDDTITLKRGTLYGYNGDDAKISSIGFFDAGGTKLFGWYVNQSQGTVVKRYQIPDGAAYVVFNTTNVSAGFDILCNPLRNQMANLRNEFKERHARTCTLSGSYDGTFVYAPVYVKAGDIVAIKGVYNGNFPVLFFSDGKRNNEWIPADQIDSSYFSEGFVVPTTGWAGFTAWAATETGDKSWRFDITVYTPRNTAEPMREIVVAASDSSADDKAAADLVCDGTDDATVINDAITIAQRIGVPDVVLCNGTFNINSYIEYNLQGSAKKVAILVHDALGKKGITIRGKKSGILPHGTILNVQESIFTNVGNDTLSIISGGAPDAGYQGSHGFNVKDIKIVLPNAQHKCIAINMQYAYWGMVENCYLQCTGYGQDVVPAEGCIAFRGWAGWSDGSLIGIKDVYAFGFYVGFQLGGEHVICERLGTRYCYYGYTFGEYPLAANSGAQVHPITLINCCDEHSAALPKFCDSGNANDRGAGRCAVDMISFNVEAYPLITNTPLVYATEATDGGWVGRIDYTIENNEKNSSVSLPFWASGHGKHFRTTNSAQLPAGTTTERTNYAPNLAQTYYDTTLGKLLVYNGSAWVDANGTAV